MNQSNAPYGFFRTNSSMLALWLELSPHTAHLAYRLILLSVTSTWCLLITPSEQQKDDNSNV